MRTLELLAIDKLILALPPANYRGELRQRLDLSSPAICEKTARMVD